jgi:hypothetical protein
VTSFDAGSTLGERFRAHSRALESSPAPSPLYAELMRRMADDWDAGGVVRDICQGWEAAPGGSVVQLRLLGALHRVVLRGDEPELAAFYPTAGGTKDPSTVWPVAHAVLQARAAELAEALAVAPQTNEPGRSAALLVGVVDAVRHSGLSQIRLLEVGASGGLNLLLDRFRFEGPDWSFGPAGSPLVLRDAVVGPVRLPLPAWSVVDRRGCDLSPVDVSTPAGRLHLESFVWPDHVGRFRRLAAALQVAADGGPVPVVDRVPAGAWLEERLPERPDPSVLTVVWQSITRLYWPVAEVERVRAAVRRAARDMPLAHVSMEYEDDDSRAVLSVDLWPGDGSAGRHDRLGTVADHGVPVRLAPGVSLGG